jgi:transposase
MKQNEIFGMALGLAGTPWTVNSVYLDTDCTPGRLNIRLSYKPGSRFVHPLSQQSCPVYDTLERAWRHLNFFQYECYLHAPVPRVDGGEEFGVKTVRVPWAEPGSGFTLLMEAMMVLLAQSGMSVAEAARTLSENDHRLWRVLHRRVDEAHEKMDLTQVKQLSVDETSVRRGHEYVTVVCEPSTPKHDRGTRVLFVAENRDSDTLRQTKEFLERRRVDPQSITEICADMSAAYTKGIRENFPDARLVYDYFHVVSLITSAVDQVRRRESRRFPELLKGTRYLWLKNEENLTEEQVEKRRRLCASKLQTAKSHCHLAAFQDLLKADEPQEAIEGLHWWYNWVTHSRIPEMIKVARTIKKHWDGLVAYLKTRLNNGPAEAINGIIQTAKRKARGFRTFVYFKTVIYLIGSKLKFDLPSPIPIHPQQTS